GESGSVAWMFDAVGIVAIDPQGKDEDQLTEAALVNGVIDIEFGEPAEVYTELTTLAFVRDALAQSGLKVADAYLGMRPKARMAPHGEAMREALHFLDALEEHEDVQRIFSNIEVSDAALEALA
ncbi:MAG: YebC/PmpR family DNA-binding transcriptional regulator, partial [Candidatus Eremiobacteraeota bacterium]|nr:YebC/PmpR family DNA-binding transcriptional regulator [Candidatus Eremiobacteraeota bacterium]